MRVMKLHPDAKLPVYSTEGAAGLDLYAHSVERERRGLYVGLYVIHTGIAVALPPRTVGRIVSRSSLFCRGFVADGTIDEDYRGELIVQLRRVDPLAAWTPKAGDRVAQLLILPVHRAVVTSVDELDETARGAGGFGSTGLK